MALLSFPPSPNNNELYPANPLPGQSQYRYDSTTQTWVLEGAATAVAPGCYGDAYTVPTFCVDAQGRLTFAQNVAIGVTGGTVTDVTAGFGLLGGTITTSGTIDLDTAYTDGIYVKYVTAPTSSADPGAIGEVAVSPGFFYFFDGTQWLQVAGSTF